MQIFDAQIRSDTRSTDDLKNLSYFDTEAVLTTAHAYQNFERAEDLLEYFNALTTTECARLQRCGLEPHVALGVLPDARPRRSHPEVWRDLPLLLENPRVVAVGEIGAWEDSEDHWELFERQLRMAKEARRDLAVVVTPPEHLRVNMTYKMMMRIERIGLAPDRVVMNRLDERLVEQVVHEGFVAGVSVGHLNLKPRKAADVLVETLEVDGAAERIVLNSSLRESVSDVLGIPKTIRLLRDRVDESLIEPMVYGNARRLFGK